MNSIWVDLLNPLTFFKLGWCAMGLITLIECLRVWRPLYRVAIIAEAESKDEGLLTWVKVPAKIAAGLAIVAGLNLLAGVISLTFPPPVSQDAARDSYREIMVLLIPLTFIISAAVKMRMANMLRVSYKKIVTLDALPESAAKVVNSL